MKQQSSLSDWINKLSVENIRLWYLKDDVMALRKELDSKPASKRELEIYKRLTQLAFDDVDIVKERSRAKKEIDETLIELVKKAKKKYSVKSK